MDIKAVIFDFGRVLIFPKDEAYFGSINDLHHVLSESPNYKLGENFVFNKELYDFLTQKKVEKGIEFYLFTRGVIAEHVDCQRFLGNLFEKIYLSENIKLEKNDPEAYHFLIRTIGLSPSEVLYVDDSRDNTSAAEGAGLSTIAYRNNMQFETEFEGYL